MEYKKCEHCGEQIHIRSKKCPFCNQIVTEVPEVVVKDTADEKVQENNVEEEKSENQENTEVKKENDVISSEIPGVSYTVGNEEPKDYVYKAEVRHSLEYTNPMSNTVKVFISALCTLPMIGQVIGAFLGVFFSTYEDTDRRTFGRALILLSIFMFVLYVAYFKYAMELLSTIDINSLYNSIGK